MESLKSNESSVRFSTTDDENYELSKRIVSDYNNNMNAFKEVRKPNKTRVLSPSTPSLNNPLRRNSISAPGLAEAHSNRTHKMHNNNNNDLNIHSSQSQPNFSNKKVNPKVCKLYIFFIF